MTRPSSSDDGDISAVRGLVEKYDLRWDDDPARPYSVTLGHVGEGWAILIEQLVLTLIELGWNRRIAQMKEKFGGLRFYIGDGTPPMFAAIDDAERRSRRICARCGKPGRITARSGYAVRCADHTEGDDVRVNIRPAGRHTVAVPASRRK